ncbi:zinc-dependent alcohol dehydrogenase [Sphingomonas sp.]|uniref:zinc-dependent alcohol dehydrogenase n=1 Tax=Sphingomonas sp. TaxID=28214 RepID=UPI002DD6526C|nr:zinc-binding dehydrogenase [Sphingomonas sp.]
MASQRVLRWTGNGRLALDRAPRPVAGERDVVLAVVACGICGSDLHFWKDGGLPPGAVMGHEFVGHAVAVGGGVAGIAPGDRLVVNPMVNGIGLGAHDGAFADYVRVPDAVLGSNVHAVPDDLDDRQAALVEPLAVGLRAIGATPVDEGTRAVVLGAGPIGLCVVAALRHRGVSRIVVSDPSPLRRERAMALGADAVHDPADTPLLPLVLERFGPPGRQSHKRTHGNADIAFDCAGIQATLDGGLAVLRHGGALVLVSAYPGHMPFDIRSVMLGELRVMGTIGYEQEFEQALQLLTRRAIDLSPLVSHVVDLDDAPAAFEVQACATSSVKVLVRPGQRTI